MTEWHTRSNHFIMKVIILCAVARPQYFKNKTSCLDRKLGLWPFVLIIPAQRSSGNCPTGTPEMKLLAAKREIRRSCLTETVNLTISSELPATQKGYFAVHQANA